MGSRYKNLYHTCYWQWQKPVTFRNNPHIEIEPLSPSDLFATEEDSMLPLVIQSIKRGKTVEGDKNYIRPMEQMLLENLRRKQRWYRDASKVHWLTVGEKYDSVDVSATKPKQELDVYQELFDLSFGQGGSSERGLDDDDDDDIGFGARPERPFGSRPFNAKSVQPIQRRSYSTTRNPHSDSFFGKFKKLMGVENKETSAEVAQESTAEKVVQQVSETVQPVKEIAKEVVHSTKETVQSATNAVQTATATKAPKEKDGIFATLGKKAMEQMAGEDAAELQKSMEAGKFDLNDYLIQMKYTSKAGKFLNYIPGSAKVLESIKQVSEHPETKKGVAILSAMTPEERKKPSLLIDGELKVKAKNRIAKAAGTDIAEVNKLLYKYQAVKITYNHIFALKKQGKAVPNDPNDLIKMIQANGGFTKKEMDILRRGNAQ